MTHTIRYAKPETLLRLGGDEHRLIGASGGTGKTYTIEHLVVDLLLMREASIRKILVIMFAERAAAELRARIRAMLVKLLLLKQDHGKTFEHSWKIGPSERQRIEQALFELDLAPIHPSTPLVCRS